jgi:polysaccharide biosynthesis transport protein
VIEAPASADTVWLRFQADSYEAQARGTVERAAYGEPVHVAGVSFSIRRPPPQSEAHLRILSQAAAVDLVLRSLTATPRERAAVIDIFYTGPDPRLAARIVNAVALAFQEHNTRGVQEAARRRREFIEAQWLQSERNLAAAQQRQSGFRSRGRLSSSPERLRAEQGALVDVDAQLDAARAERAVYQAFLRRIAGASPEQVDSELRTLVAAPGLSSGPLLTTLYTQFSQYQTEQERLLAAGLAMTHPDVERLTTLMSRARSSVVDAARTQVASLDLRLTSLQDQRARAAANIESLPDFEGDETRLAQDVAVARSSTEALRAEYQRARLAEAVNVGQAEILDLAAGAMPVKTGRRLHKLFLAGLFGTMLGFGIILLLEFTNGSIRWRGDMDALVAVPTLGTIPHIEPPKQPRGRANGRKPAAPGVPGARVLPHIAATNFHTLAAEAYRLLRTNLAFGRPPDSLRSLLVTSASSGEGKTTTAANLAASFALRGTRVLLVDCDLRRPRLHRFFELDPSPGFIDLLLGRAQELDAIRTTHIAGLSLLPRGGFDEQAAEILGTEPVARLIAGLSTRYDLIIFDTPPVLAASDAAALAPLVDGALVVIRAGQTDRDAAKQAVQQLEAVGAEVLGFVLNDPDAIAKKYGEYAYAREYYSVSS